MGCDIHPYAEARTPDGWQYDDVNVLDCRDYNLFGFLADVRNYSRSPVIAEPRGLPDDVSSAIRQVADWYGNHSHSWLMLAELLAYDYDQVIWDRRIERDGNGAALAEEGEGEHLPLREFLGAWYFTQLDLLGTLGAPEDVRIVFWFDN